MKRVIVFLLSVMILVIGVKIINNLLNPKIEYALDRKSKNLDSSEVYNFGDHFKTFTIDNLNSFTYDDINLHVYFNEDKLVINDKTITNVRKVYDYFALYDDTLLMICYEKDETSHLLFYNFLTGEEIEKTNYKGMVIDFDKGITFDDDGVVVGYKLIDDGLLIDSKKDICKLKNKEQIVFIKVQYAYDSIYKKVGDLQELYSYNLMTYIKQNNLC